jgi:hypothetical protein
MLQLVIQLALARMLAKMKGKQLEILKELKEKKTQVIDCKGKTLLPGFIDAHCHIRAFAEKLVSLDLSPGAGIDSIPNIQDKIREIAGSLPTGAWIRGKERSRGERHAEDHRNHGQARPGSAIAHVQEDIFRSLDQCDDASESGEEDGDSQGHA